VPTCPAAALCGLVVAFWLPEGATPRPGKLAQHIGAMRRHLGDRRIRAACLLGAAALFCMTATLSYIGFRLAAPPYGFSAAGIGLIFLGYPLAASSTGLTGPLLRRFGVGGAVRCALGLCLAGQGLLLVPAIGPILLGLTGFIAGIFLVQSLALSYVGRVAGAAKGAAVGLYVCCFYVGGSLGAVLPGLAWAAGGWAGCSALVAAALALGLAATAGMSETS
jgi:predicted MFS family arabinose efflux permease